MTDGGGGATEQLVEAGHDALARGAWEEARESFQAALRDRETPGALEGLSWAAWWLNDPEVVLRDCADDHVDMHRLLEAVLEQVGKDQTDRLRHALAEAAQTLSA